MTEDRRCDRELPGGGTTGGATCNPGEGTQMTYRQFLGENFFKDLEIMKTLGPPEDIRVVFGFDS